MTLAMAQASAAGNLKAMANYIETCEEVDGGLSDFDLRLIAKHVLLSAEQYRKESGEADEARL